jgi:plastocyanin
MHRRQFHVLCASGAVIATTQSFLSAADKIEAADKAKWGNLTATFIYDGEPPEPIRLKVDKDKEAIKEPLFDRSLMVDAKTKGIANVVTWLYLAKDAKLPAIHPSYEAVAKKEVVVTYRNAQFEPYVSAVRTGQTLVFKNVDHMGHNAKGEFRNAGFQQLIPAAGDEKYVFTKPESVPSPVACAIHSWMSAYVLVKDHPYFGISNGDGKLSINSLPVGRHTFVVWHQLPGFITDVKRKSKAETWKLGRVTVDIEAGDNDLGEIVFKPEQNLNRSPVIAGPPKPSHSAR